MSKLKTSKSALKRVTISSTGKFMRRATNAGHFNAKDNGAERNRKSNTATMNASNMKDMEHLLPYHG